MDMNLTAEQPGHSEQATANDDGLRSERVPQAEQQESLSNKRPSPQIRANKGRAKVAFDRPVYELEDDLVEARSLLRILVIALEHDDFASEQAALHQTAMMASARIGKIADKLGFEDPEL